MKQHALIINEMKILSNEEMSEIYGGGWLKDLLEYVDKHYTEFKKGISDGLNYR